MPEICPDLVERYRLETEFFHDHVTHTRYVEKAKNRNKKAKEHWGNCGELGEGAFGVVHKQIQKTTSRYRAVKTVAKRSAPGLDYSRELLVMAILAKWPSLFVEFLGWFEEPETLYIAMEYLGGGDLTRYIGSPLPQETVRNISKQILEGLEVMHQQGIAHRDLKPANIFVVSISPIWVKLGDFGISKRIQSQDTTTFHTRISTPVYSAPEVLGLDANSETSDYTNSVDIWSLGCVIYELLAGKRLFISEGQVFRYYLGSLLFPEDELEGLSPPANNVGISLLKSMLTIQPENRPTAAGALGHEWLVGLGAANEASRDHHDERAQSRDESSQGRKGQNNLATNDKPAKRRDGRNTVTRDDTKYDPGDAALVANPGFHMCTYPAIPESTIFTSVMTPPVASSAEGTLIGTGTLESGLVPHNCLATHSKRHKAPRKRQIRNIPKICPQDFPQAISQRQIIPSGHIARWYTPKSPIPSPPYLIQQQKGLRAGESALPGETGSGQEIRELQWTKSYRIPPLIPVVGEPAEAGAAQPSTQYEAQIPGEILMTDQTLLLAGILILAAILSRALILVGTLALVGILSRTLMLPGDQTPEGIEIADRAHRVSNRTQTRLGKRYQRRRGRVHIKRER